MVRVLASSFDYRLPHATRALSDMLADNTKDTCVDLHMKERCFRFVLCSAWQLLWLAGWLARWPQPLITDSSHLSHLSIRPSVRPPASVLLYLESCIEINSQ